MWRAETVIELLKFRDTCMIHVEIRRGVPQHLHRSIYLKAGGSIQALAGTGHIPADSYALVQY